MLRSLLVLLTVAVVAVVSQGTPALGVSNTNDNCAWASPAPVSLTVSFPTNGLGPVAGTRYPIGMGLGTSRNVDVLCLSANETRTTGSLGATVLIEYADGSYPIRWTGQPIRVRGNGRFDVPWSAALLITQADPTYRGALTVTIGTMPSQPLSPDVKSNPLTGLSRVDASVSAKSGEARYVHLGQGTQLTLSWLDVFSQPLSPTKISGCPSTTSYSLDLVTGPHCVYANLKLECCLIDNRTACEASTTAKGCHWSQVEEACFSIEDAVSLRPFTDGAMTPMTFVARRPSADGTSYRTGATARWGLRYRSLDAAGCNAFVDLTAAVTVGGGVCEPSLMADCDSIVTPCLLSPTGGEALVGHGSRYCRCLALQEVCYRQAGCTRTPMYDMIASDCATQGCGQMCSSAIGPKGIASLVFATVIMVASLL